MSAAENGDTVSGHGTGAGAAEPTAQPTTLTNEQPTEPANEQLADDPSEAKAVAAPDTNPETIARIADRARRLVSERIRAALVERTAATPAPQPPSDLDDEQLDRIADEEAGRADGALLRVALVHAVSQELGIEVEDALEHPAVDRARELLRQDGGAGPADGAASGDDPRRTPATDAVRRDTPPRTPLEPALLLDAVHVFGIETLEPNDQDIELRLADVGIDVRKPSTGETIGRLRWDEVRTVAVQRPRRGLPSRRRPAVFVAGTDRGEVTFNLPGLSEDEITRKLGPLIARNCADYSDTDAG